MELQWRAPTDGDLDAWVEALAAIEAFDRTGEVLGRQDLEEQLGLSYVDRERDARLGWCDGTIVAWGVVWSLPSPDQRRVLLDGAVIPSARGHGVGARLVELQMARGREIAAAGDPASPAWLELSASEADVTRAELFRARGFSPHRYYFEMRRALTEVPTVRPAGADIDLQQFDFAIDEAVRATHNEAFHDHFASSELDAETWHLWVTGHHNFRADCSFVAVDGETIVGYALNSIHPDDWPGLGFKEGWTHQLGVLRPWRNRGVATALLHATADAFGREGLDYAALDVDADSPTGALALYEGQGYRRDKTRVAWSFDLPECSRPD